MYENIFSLYKHYTYNTNQMRTVKIKNTVLN